MKTLDRLTAALGEPQLLRELGGGDRPIAAVGRWRHTGARVELGGLDATQLVLNVSGGQVVELRSGDQLVRSVVRAGSIGVVAPESLTDIAIYGEADTVQILISADLLKMVVYDHSQAMMTVDSASRERLLQAAAAQVLVGLRSGSEEALTKLEALVRRIARLLSPASRPKSLQARGGLAPGARRRIRKLVDSRCGTGAYSSPSLDELAEAAGLSPHHFIRAFRQTEGQTPCAWLARRRIDVSLALLLGGPHQVGDIADALGFASSSHFVSAFRRHIGVTPGALRDAAVSTM